MATLKALENVGVLHYDVPDEICRFGDWLRRSLRCGHALPASKSVWLINWADLPRLQGILDLARAKYGEKYPEDSALFARLKFAFLKFDNASSEQAYQMAVTGLTALLKDIQKSVYHQIKRAAERNEPGITREYQRLFVQKVREARVLAVAFRLMDDVVGPLEETWKLVEENVGAEVAARLVKKIEAQEKRVVQTTIPVAA
jgi:hypothetical protein